MLRQVIEVASPRSESGGQVANRGDELSETRETAQPFSQEYFRHIENKVKRECLEKDNGKTCRSRGDPLSKIVITLP